MILPKILW